MRRAGTAAAATMSNTESTEPAAHSTTSAANGKAIAQPSGSRYTITTLCMRDQPAASPHMRPIYPDEHSTPLVAWPDTDEEVWFTARDGANRFTAVPYRIQVAYAFSGNVIMESHDIQKRGGVLDFTHLREPVARQLLLPEVSIVFLGSICIEPARDTVFVQVWIRPIDDDALENALEMYGPLDYRCYVCLAGCPDADSDEERKFNCLRCTPCFLCTSGMCHIPLPGAGNVCLDCLDYDDEGHFPDSPMFRRRLAVRYEKWFSPWRGDRFDVPST